MMVVMRKSQEHLFSIKQDEFLTLGHRDLRINEVV